MSDTLTNADPFGKQPAEHRPEWVVVTSFGLAILVGTLLLVLPVSSHDGTWTHPIDALFTAASATCVTGLIVLDTGTHFSPFGQSIILILIQLGGLGIMTMGTFLLIAVGRRLSLHQERVVLGTIGTGRARGLKSILLLTVLFTLATELLGALILTARFVRHGLTLQRSVHVGVFHAISAFCNAGFSLFDDSLIGVRDDHVIVLTLALLVVLGGLGFVVVHDLLFLRPWRRDRFRRGALSLHSRIVLVATGLLILTGWLLFGLLEWRGTLAQLPWPVKLTASLFQSVSPRTAGFNMVDMGAVTPPALFLTMILMFIGGGAGSAAGGIKVSTAVVLWQTVMAMVKSRHETVIYGRSVPVRVVREAISIFVLSVLCISLFYGALLLAEQGNPLRDPGETPFDLLFELVSAFGTVGLSTGITPQLSPLGRLLITACMFIGRLGPMTLALVIGRRQLGQAVSFPEEEILVG